MRTSLGVTPFAGSYNFVISHLVIFGLSDAVVILSDAVVIESFGREPIAVSRRMQSVCDNALCAFTMPPAGTNDHRFGKTKPKSCVRLRLLRFGGQLAKRN